MDDQNLIGEYSPELKPLTRRRRGTHAVTCKCPNPFYVRPEDYKSLPGEAGHVLRKLMRKDKSSGRWSLRRRVSRDPYFVFLRKAAGRERDFRPERRALIDALVPLLVNKADLANWIVTTNISRLAAELSPKNEDGHVVRETCVEVSRLSRLFQELARFGLCELPDLDWDPVEKCWMPRHIVLTDSFWKLAGASMDKLLQQRVERLQAEEEGIAEPGTRDSLRASRRRWFEKMRMATFIRRRERAIKEKRKRRLGRLALDDRRSAMAAWLIRTRPNHELRNMAAADFDRMVWSNLNQLELGLGYEPAPPDIVH